jgi:DivIVA domain-containing protein
MAEELTPADIRARKFGATRRGFDRSEVTAFLERVAGRVGTLEAELADIRSRLHQLGITDLPNLKEELDDIGVEIQAVLDAAMEAAEGLRARAATDAADSLAAADLASKEMRGDAWNVGTQLLQQADAEADHLVAEAREDALFIRAEAEQEAKRLATDARRQADEMVRSSREEGERIVVIAKAESEAILEGARQSAEKAQERARALENRRAELLGELEAAEAAIKDVETTRGEREHATETGVRVIASGTEERTHWPEDEGAVRVLPSVAPQPEPIPPEPVDAEAMAAEVEQMRSAVTMPKQVEATEADIVEDEVEEVDVAAAAPEPAEPVAEIDDPATAELPRLSGDEADDADLAVGAEEDAAVSELEPAAESVAAVEDKTTIVRDDPDIDALFAKLRLTPEPEAEPVIEESPSEIADEPDDEAHPPDLHVVPPLDVADDFERRDRMLLPIENRGLRGVKRRIVELSSGEWRLGREFVVEMMGDELDAVLLDSFQAGHAAAAETIDKDEPQLTGGPQQGAAEIFTADLHRDVQAVIERDSEGGSRRMSSDVGRVFRSWRTDEAERHVRQAARRAFNDGLLAGYERLGVGTVELAAPGRPCGACAAGSGIVWAPGEALPEGVEVPPVGPSCAAMVMPAGANGS